MTPYPPAVADHLAARKPLLSHVLLWLSARDRATGALEHVGLWTGADHQDIAVSGQARTYYGAGALVGMEPITQRTGLEVRQHRVTLSPLSPAAVDALRLYDPRLAPVEIHEWFWDPETMNALADPIRIFKGHIVQAPINTPAEGGEATCELTLVSAAWELTQPLPLKRSHAALTARNPGDNFRRYGDISGSVETAWGEKLANVAQASGATAAKKDASQIDVMRSLGVRI